MPFVGRPWALRRTVAAPCRSGRAARGGAGLGPISAARGPDPVSSPGKGPAPQPFSKTRTKTMYRMLSALAAVALTTGTLALAGPAQAARRRCRQRQPRRPQLRRPCRRRPHRAGASASPPRAFAARSVDPAAWACASTPRPARRPVTADARSAVRARRRRSRARLSVLALARPLTKSIEQTGSPGVRYPFSGARPALWRWRGRGGRPSARRRRRGGPTSGRPRRASSR